MSLPNIAYELTPIFPLDSKLEEVVSERSNKVSKTALELFGESYQALNDKLEYKKNISWKINMLPAIPGLSTIGLLISSAGLKSWYLCVAGMCMMPIFSVSVYAENWFQKNYGADAAFFLKGSETVTDFYNCFEDFKANPTDLKVTNLFLQFDKMNDYLEIIRGNQLFEFDELPKTYMTRKFFLMDVVVQIFKNKDQDSIFLKQWDKIADTSSSFNLSDSIVEPWKSIGIESPDLASYIFFGSQRQQLQSIEIADKITSLFKKAMEEALQTHKI